MATKTQRKRKFQRRRAHAVLTRGRPGLIAAVEQITGSKVLPHQEAAVKAVLEQPKRAQCPECGTSQKIRRDGTVGKHTYGPEGRACAGTGRKWND